MVQETMCADLPRAFARIYRTGLRISRRYDIFLGCHRSLLAAHNNSVRFWNCTSYLRLFSFASPRLGAHTAISNYATAFQSGNRIFHGKPKATFAAFWNTPIHRHANERSCALLCLRGDVLLGIHWLSPTLTVLMDT